ncbi:MAG: hypothetical protein V7634_186 [Bradyrhizobium sp.]|jgi:hypothetical protein
MSKVAVGRARSMRQSHDSTDQLYNLTARFGASTPNSNRADRGGPRTGHVPGSAGRATIFVPCFGSHRSEPDQLRSFDMLTQALQFAQLGNETGCRLSKGCDTSLERAHSIPPRGKVTGAIALTLGLRLHPIRAH